MGGLGKGLMAGAPRGAALTVVVVASAPGRVAVAALASLSSVFVVAVVGIGALRGAPQDQKQCSNRCDSRPRDAGLLA